jgi:hypothetical protein
LLRADYGFEGRVGLKNRARAGEKSGSIARRRILIILLVVGCVAPGLVYAERTRIWRESSYADFDKGTTKGVAIRSNGTLAAAPKFGSYSDPNMAY